MMKKLLVTFVFALLAAASLDAELKYTMQVRANKLADAPPPANPMFAMMGQQAIAQMLPNGAIETIVIVGERGVRTEYPAGGMGQPAGSVMLARQTPDGQEMIVMDPKQKTYWKLTGAQATAMFQQAGVTPQVTVNRTGEFATVAGLRTEKVAMTMDIPLPIPPEAVASLPPGFPTTLSMRLDNWITVDRYKDYAAMASRGNAMLAQFGVDISKIDGIMMRSLLRSDLFAGYEIESVVTSIGEETVPASMFEVPADFKQVQPPGIGG